MAKTREAFKYTPRKREEVQQRANQQGGLFDSYIHDKFPMFRPKEGDFQLRFLPPTWENPDHYGYDISLHYGVGADNQAYLCPAKMHDRPCVICEERKLAEQAGDSDYARSLAPVKRVLVWVIDRDAEVDGPQVWPMPWTVDRDFAMLSIDKRSGEVICLDDPERGFDVAFGRRGTGIKTKYAGMQVARRSTPLSDDPKTQAEWLAFVVVNPLTSVFRFYDPDHVRSIFMGGRANADEDTGSAEPEEEESTGAAPAEDGSLFGTPDEVADASKAEESVKQPARSQPPPAPPAGKKMSADELFSLVDDDEEDEAPETKPRPRSRIRGS